jgi:hypothetical protein
MTTPEEIAKKLTSIEARLKAIEEDIRGHPREVILRYYEERLTKLEGELREVEKLEKKLRLYAALKPEKLEKELKDLKTKREKLAKELENEEKKEHKDEKELEKKAKKLESLRLELKELETKELELEDKRKFAGKKDELEGLVHKKSYLVEEGKKLRLKIGELRNESGKIPLGKDVKRCVFCGMYFTGVICTECGAKLVGKIEPKPLGPVGKETGKYLALLKYGTIFFLVGLILIVLALLFLR